MDSLGKLYECVKKEKWLSHLYLSIWGHSVKANCIFEWQGRDNGTDVWLHEKDIRGLMKSGELHEAVGISSFTKGMGDGYFIKELPNCSWNDIGYTMGLNDLPDSDITMDALMKFLKEKFDLIVDRLRYLEKIREEHKLLDNCQPTENKP